MKQFFKNKFFYIVTVVALIVAIVPTVFYSMGLTFVFRDAVGVVLAPAQKLFNNITEAIDGFASYFYKFDELAEENNRLKEEISEYQSKIYTASELEEMYVWMSDFLELKMSHTDFKMLEASVIGRESGNYSKILNLDVGSSSGVRQNMPVVTSDGVVGQITEVGLNWSKVTTVLESGSSEGAYIERTGDAGVCIGSFDTAADGICLLSYIPEDSDVQLGDRVLTSGYGSVYPRGLVIGYVISIEDNPYSRTLDIKVQCSTEYSDLTRVMVITSFDSFAENASALVNGNTSEGGTRESVGSIGEESGS